MRLVATRPHRTGRADALAGVVTDLADEPVLHVVPEAVVRDQLRRFRSTSPPLGMPLSERRPILEPERPRRRIPAQLPRDRRRRPAQPPGDVSNAELLRVPYRDVLTLRE